MKTRIRIFRSVPLFFVSFRVVRVFRVFRLSKKLTTKHTNHTKKNTKEETTFPFSDPALIRLIRPIRVQKNVSPNDFSRTPHTIGF